MRSGLFSLFFVTATSAVAAQDTPLKPELSDIAFLVGDWTNGAGQIAENGGRSRGSSSVTVVANGGAMLRRDHTDLIAADGKPMGGFDQIMMIYPEGGTLHADYSDGQHVIHYTSAMVAKGASVTFLSAMARGVPTFRLAYRLMGPTTLSVTFSMAPPGSEDFHPIATGTLTRKT